MKKLCIVTPPVLYDLAVYDYALRLLPENYRADYDVTVLEAQGYGKKEGGGEAFWEEKGMHYLTLESLNLEKFPIQPLNLFTQSAYGLYQYFLSHVYDFICFDCMGGLGFYTIQAKRTTDCFDTTTIAVHLQSNSQWFTDSNEIWNDKPIEDTCVWYAERYCAQHGDILISPTHYMFEWAINHRWVLSENRHVIPYHSFQQTNLGNPEKTNLKHLIFFGYLRVNSGVELFCSLIKELHQTHDVEQVSFVGRDDWMYGCTSSQHVKNFCADLGLVCNVETHLDMEASIEHVKFLSGIVICPPAYTNYSWQAAACQDIGVPFLASRVGGNVEWIADQLLFDCNLESLMEKLKWMKTVGGKLPVGTHQKSPADITLNELYSFKSLPINEIICKQIQRDQPRVSICIAYYNLYNFLEMTLRSIDKTTYSNYEVIVVDDGSPCPLSNEAFNALSKQYNRSNWHFYQKENEYLGKTRNFSVEKASGEYIIFVDQDNIPTPNMVADFLFGIYKSGMDCLTCHIDTFLGIEEPNEYTKTAEIVLPLGPVLELGYIQNFFGDANFIIKKECYQKAGGFPTERLSMDDWTFLAKFSLKGFHQDVIPKQLYKYRVLENSMVRTGNNYKSLKRIFDVYKDTTPDFVYFMIDGVTEPLYLKSEIMLSNIGGSPTSAEDMLHKIKHVFGVVCPQKSLRRKLAFRIARWLKIL